MSCIYKLTNIINNKCYVGQTKFTAEKRWKQHVSNALSETRANTYLYNAIRKYGEESFVLEVIVDNIPSELVDDLETNCIAMEDAFTKGYNMLEEGRSTKGRVLSEDAILRIKEANKNRVFTEDTRKKMSESRTGVKASKETKAKMSEQRKGTKCYMFKPWYMIEPNGTRTEFHDITIQEYASILGIQSGFLYTRFSKQFEGKVAKRRGALQGYTFGYIK